MISDRALVDALCEIPSGMTDKEVDFVEASAASVIDHGRELTKAERERGLAILKRLRRRIPQ